jgi:hypothetical protein
MSGERDLGNLLAGLEIIRHDGVWEFVTGTQEGVPGAVMQFKEREGWTHIVSAHRSAVDDQRFIWLELAVHSDLNAVGFLAVISNALADAGVPCNAIAAFYHDHIFVPESKAETAILTLERLKT